jgi:uncharacterized protein YndB with AHSA1/START domain
MDTKTKADAYGALIEPATLKIQRLLPGPIERIWAYLTDSELRRKWLAAGAMDRLSIAWNNSGDVTFELEPRGEGVLLTVIHRRLPDRSTMLKVSAGWHMHLDILVARAMGNEPAPFWEGWSRLQKEYDRRLPA